MHAGFVCIDKPPDITSRDAVNVMQTLVRPLKAGHAGTLDPLATGVLVVAVGRATRLLEYVQQGRKQYRGTFRLGQTSDTDDITGTVVDAGDASKTNRERLLTVLAEFVGQIEQVPPKFSAVHVQGRRAYDLARRGVSVELAARVVEVDAITLLDFALPDFTIDVTCGGGTYLRSLGRDIGQRLGCGALMTALRRTAVGPFTLHRACQLDELTDDNWMARVLPPALAVSHLASAMLSARQESDVRCGRMIPLEAMPPLAVDGEIALIDGAGGLIGVGAIDRNAGCVHPRLILASA